MPEGKIYHKGTEDTEGPSFGGAAALAPSRLDGLKIHRQGAKEGFSSLRRN